MSVEDETWDRPSCEFCGATIPYGKKLEHGRGICRKKPLAQKVITPQSEYLEQLKAIQHELKTQDNRCTADPIFLVEECERITGMDSEYVDDYVWYDLENHSEADEEETKMLEDLDDKLEDIPNQWQKCYYFDKWKTVQSFFTEKAAQQYVDSCYYRHRGKLRVYADSLYRNHEMKMIRDYILNL